MIVLIISLLLLLIGLFVCLLIFVWDLSIPEIDLVEYVHKRYKKLGITPNQRLHFLTIYPHPDDETMMSGGTLAKYAGNPQVRCTVVSLTPGEHGDELRRDLSPEMLGNLRKLELQHACSCLKVRRIVGPFEDGTLKHHEKKLKDYIEKLYQIEKPDLVITFEKAGVYGHPDHITASRVIRELQKQQPIPVVLYSTWPQKILRKYNLPTHMADDPAAVIQALPEMRVSFWRWGWKKYKAALCHKSQNLNSNGKAPLWAFTMLSPIEYFSED